MKYAILIVVLVLMVYMSLTAEHLQPLPDSSNRVYGVVPRLDQPADGPRKY